VTYVVKECFFTLQGEGARSGTVAVFCRFTGCNLWSGRPEDRAIARCRFCDTDFVGTDGPGGGRFTEAEQLARHIESVWTTRVPDRRQPRSVVFTGGEPTLQLDAALVSRCKALGFHVAIETNGTRMCPSGLDWICVSPKAGNAIAQRSGHELKVAWPQPGLCLTSSKPSRSTTASFSRSTAPTSRPIRASASRHACSTLDGDSACSYTSTSA